MQTISTTVKTEGPDGSFRYSLGSGCEPTENRTTGALSPLTVVGEATDPTGNCSRWSAGPIVGKRAIVGRDE